jgi:hypothetical protein
VQCLRAYISAADASGDQHAWARNARSLGLTASKPSSLEFGAGSGALEAPAALEGTISGKTKIIGYEEVEVLTAK